MLAASAATMGLMSILKPFSPSLAVYMVLCVFDGIGMSGMEIGMYTVEQNVTQCVKLINV